MSVVHIISHTHWDREWYVPFQFTREWLPRLFDNLFALLEKEPQYVFVLNGSTEVIDDYLEQLLPDERTKKEVLLKKYVKASQILVGPYYVQIDWNLAGGETIVRNLLYGFRDSLRYGAVQRVGWLADNFGQTSQTVQIHRQFSCEGIFVWRGLSCEEGRTRTEYLWRSPDGSELPTAYLIDSYRNGMQLERTEFSARVGHAVSRLKPFAGTPHMLMMNGYDQEFVPDNVPALIRKAKKEADLEVRQSSPTEFIREISRSRPDVVIEGTQLDGEHVAIFPGVWSNRPYLKSESARIERLLSGYLEPLSAILHAKGYSDAREELRRLWQEFLKMQAHDNICGVSVDDIHVEMEHIFAGILEDGALLLHAYMSAPFAPGTHLHCLVFNPLAKRRDSILEIQYETQDEEEYFASLGAAVQLRMRKQGCFVFLRGLPALSLAPLAAFAAPLAPPPLEFSQAQWTVRNAHCELKLHADGSFSLKDLPSSRVYGPLHVLEDTADAGDTYNYSSCRHDRSVHTLRRLRRTVLEQGPLAVKLSVEAEIHLPVALTVSRRKRRSKCVALPLSIEITVTALDRVISFKTELVNTACDHRLQMLFSTGLAAAKTLYHLPFDVTSPEGPSQVGGRAVPEELERLRIGAKEVGTSAAHPFHHFAALAEGSQGFALLSKSFSSCERRGDVLAVDLYRSVGWLARGDLLSRQGDAGPCIATPDAQLLRPLVFEYGIASFNEGRAELLDICDEYLSPPHWLTTGLDVSSPPEVIEGDASYASEGGALRQSGYKIAEDGEGAIFRCYNPLDEAVTLRVETPEDWRISRVNCLESPQEALDGTTQEVAPHRIETLRLEYPKPKRRKTHAHDVISSSRAFVQLNAPWQYSQMGLSKLLSDECERLACIEKECEEFRRRFEAHPEDLACRDVYSTRYRESLEARLSCVFLRHRLETGTRAYSEEITEEIRDLAWKFNKARIEKRCVDFLIANAAQS